MRLLAAALVTGCSFVGVRGPATPTSEDCTTSYGWVEVDATGAVITGGLGALGLYSAFNPPSELGASNAREVLGVFSAFAFVYVLATWYGADNVHACRVATQSARAVRSAR